MKRVLFTILTTGFAAIAAAQTNTATKQPVSVDIDGYAARVNDRIITRGEVREAMAPILPEIYRNFQGPRLQEELDKAFDQTRDELVERALIMEAFKARGGQIPEQYINDEIRRIISERFKGDEALFEQVLSEQKRTREEYREMISEQMAVGMMINEEVSRRARITPEQVRKAYEEERERYFIPEKVRHSVIVLNKGETEEDRQVKRAEAERIRQRLMDGADFAETAKAVSEGARADEGGSFPWLQPKDVRPELQETLHTLPAGEISEVIETENQLYIVKVDARRQAAFQPFEEVREDIKNALTARERERLKARWIRRLRDSNYIVIYE